MAESSAAHARMNDMGRAFSAADVIERAAKDVVAAVQREHDARIDRTRHEAAVAASLIGNLNPETGKPHSASSAKEAAAIDPRTLELRTEAVDAECAVILARAAYQAALVRAWATVRVAAVMEV